MLTKPWLGLAALTTGLCFAFGATAAPQLRLQVDQNGDFALIGNTLGHECAGGTPAPVVGTVGACGANLADSSPDVFWRSESPGAGQAEANTGITLAQARSTAILTLPAGATVTHAFLYWAGNQAGGDATATLDRPGGSTTDLTAIDTFLANNNAYQSVAEVTAFVAAAGSGAYRVSGVDTTSFPGTNNNNIFGGWWLVVFYDLATDPPRNLALFDGLDTVTGGNAQTATLSGFLVPEVFSNAKLGVITFEGDNSIFGDQFFFDGAQLSNGVNPANNFFNGTRSFLGAAVSVAGDLPQLTGTPQSMSGMDLDVVDVTAQLIAGQTSAPIQATSTGDVYHLAGFVTSIPTFKPDFSNSEKTAEDLNGGSLVVGDTIEYTIVATNEGNDDAVNVVLTDALPVGVTYSPGTLEITAGANSGQKTDPAGDDQCEYDGPSRTVTCRLGTGADASQGGQMAIGESSTLVFQVTVDPGAVGVIANQGIITAEGLLGAPPEDTPTDGNGSGSGNPPTEVVVDQCLDHGDCSSPTPYCETSQSPKLCVECLLDAHCPGDNPTCDLASNTCVCIPSGEEICDGLDNDCNGTVDDGFDTGEVCSAGVGECEASGVLVCASPSSTICNAVPGSPVPELCDGLDNDCDGVIDNDCGGVDSDGDGLSDEYEIQIGTDPNDADSDDDGVPDGDEPNLAEDSDGDGLINALDPDSDNDGLFDGTEMGYDCANADTDLSAGNCVPDGDGGATTTNPLDADTDDGGVSDGSEDTNLNGVIDPGETDPNDPSDDDSVLDSDGDGLSDALEIQIGTDPFDADSDDDGVIDGLEPNPAADSDGDGLINALDPDSDNDGLFDGTEMGFDCENGDTDLSAGNCIPDGDGGATTTSPVNPDTDGGGVPDGVEDANHNGVIDEGETDPNDPADDVVGGCQTDADCGVLTSGMVCDDNHLCIEGCRGTGGNGCPSGETCSSSDGTIGNCSGGQGGSGPSEPSGLVAEGGACNCHAAPSGSGRGAALAALGLALALARRRRRQPR